MKNALVLSVMLFSGLASAQQPASNASPYIRPQFQGLPPVPPPPSEIDKRIILQMENQISDLQKQINELKATVEASH